MQLMNRVGPATGEGACSSAGSSRVWGDWLLCRMLVILVNPGRGTHCQTMVPSIEVSILGLNVASGVELPVVTGKPELHQEQSYWGHHSTGSSQLGGEPFFDCGGYGHCSDAAHHLSCGG